MGFGGVEASLSPEGRLVDLPAPGALRGGFFRQERSARSTPRCVWWTPYILRHGANPWPVIFPSDLRETRRDPANWGALFVFGAELPSSGVRSFTSSG